MKKLLIVWAFLAMPAAPLAAQPGPHLYTRPTPPSRQALDRLHLQMGWRAYLPLDGRRDGIFSAQLIDNQFVVESMSGSVVAINVDDGVTQWRTRIGTPYRLTHELAANKSSFIAVRSGFLYDIDRKTGRTRWEFDLPNALSAAPAADDEQVYACVGQGQLLVFRLPESMKKDDPKLADKTEEKTPEPAPQSKVTAYDSPYAVRAVTTGTTTSAVHSPFAMLKRHVEGPQPEFAWEYKADTRLERAPLLTDEHVVLAGTDGAFFLMSKVNDRVPYKFQTGAALAAPLGVHASLGEDGHIYEIAYVPSRDFNLYAFDTVRGRVLWRFTAGAPILHKPQVTDEDIYLTAERVGLYRLNRLTGDVLWHNTKAERFLAMNKKFAYACDRQGRLLILDRASGKELASLDTSGFVVPISNEWTDRIFLASNDGLIVCLHDRDYPTPLRTKNLPVRKPPADKTADEDKPKTEDKPKAEPKDKPKAAAPKAPPKPAEKGKEDDK